MVGELGTVSLMRGVCIYIVDSPYKRVVVEINNKGHPGNGRKEGNGKPVITYHASSLSRVSSFSNVSRHLSIETLLLLEYGIGNCKIENTL